MKGYSQEVVANQLGLDPGTYSRMERGYNMMNLISLEDEKGTVLFLDKSWKKGRALLYISRRLIELDIFQLTTLHHHIGGLLKEKEKVK